MKTKLFLLLFLAFTGNIYAQKYISKTGHVWFFSHTPMEDIEAHNHQAVSILDSKTGDLQFSLLIKSFEFKVALMQEHFNENYMESTTFPKATFKGKISEIEKIDFNKDGEYKALVNGDLAIHGTTKSITTEGTIKVLNGKISALAKFSVSPSDYNIIIPSVVENKIAKSVDITIDASYD